MNQKQICHDLAIISAKTMYEKALDNKASLTEKEMHFHMLKHYKSVYDYLMSVFDSVSSHELD